MGTYTNAWSEFKSRRNNALVAIFCAFALGIYAFSQDHNRTIYPVAFIATIFCMTGATFFYRRWRSWPCPKCGKPFMANRGDTFGEGIYLTFGTKHCSYCGLTKSDIIAKSSAGA
jgi:hypothetical protein